MTVLAPALLALGAAVAVPLVLHLLHRHRAPRVVFPAIRYLRRAEHDRAGRIRLRQWLLLALRVLGILLLATAAARPFLRGAGSAHEPTAVAIVLDNSMSTGAVVEDRRVLDTLKDAALATLADASRDDVFWLLRAGEPWEPAVRGAADAVAEAVRRTVPGDGDADLGAAVDRAHGILETSPLPAREIHVLTDLQATGLPARGFESGHPIRILDPLGRPPLNRAVTRVEVGGGLTPRAHERSTVSASIDGPGDSVTVRLTVGTQVRGVARAPTGTSVLLALPAQPPGFTTGHVEIDRDALAADDRRRFVARVAAPPAVSVSEPLPFLEEALDVLAGAGRIRRVRTDADVLVAPVALGADALLRGVDVVILPPATALELPAANRRLAEAGVPWRLEGPTDGEARLDTTGLTLAGALAGERLRRVYRLTPAGPTGPDGNDSVRIRLTSGAPWAVSGVARGTTAGGRYVVLATPLTPGATTLPTSAAMIPLLDRVLGGWLAETGWTGRRPGHVITFPRADSVTRPDGAVERLDGSRYQVTEAGFYRAWADDSLAAVVAVNPPPEESDLAREAAAELARRGEGDIRVAGPGDWGTVIYHRRLGGELTVGLVVLALAAFLLESAASAAGRAA